MKLSAAVVLFTAVTSAILQPEQPHGTLFKGSEHRVKGIGEYGKDGGNIWHLAETLADSHGGRPLFQVPPFANISSFHGGIRVSENLRQRMKEREIADYGARHVCTEGGRGHIYFLDSYPKDGKSYVYHISTPWKVTYPGRIERKLLKSGFKVLNKPNGMGCDVWGPLFTVHSSGINRGSVELNWPEEVYNRIYRMPELWAVHDWDMIENIMDDLKPIVEISLIVFGCLAGSALLGVAFYFGYRFMSKKYGWNDRAKDYWSWRRQHMRNNLAQSNGNGPTQLTTAA